MLNIVHQAAKLGQRCKFMIRVPDAVCGLHAKHLASCVI